MLEGGFSLCQLLHDGLEARFLVFRQVYAGQGEVADSKFQQACAPFAHAVPLRRLAFAEALIEPVEPLVVAEFGGISRQRRQTGVVGSAQLGRIGH